MGMKQTRDTDFSREIGFIFRFQTLSFHSTFFFFEKRERFNSGETKVSNKELVFQEAKTIPPRPERPVVSRFKLRSKFKTIIFETTVTQFYLALLSDIETEASVDTLTAF